MADHQQPWIKIIRTKKPVFFFFVLLLETHGWKVNFSGRPGCRQAIMDDRQKSRKFSSTPGTNRKQSFQPGEPSTDGPKKRSEAENSSAPSLSGVLNDWTQASLY